MKASQAVPLVAIAVVALGLTINYFALQPADESGDSGSSPIDAQTHQPISNPVVPHAHPDGHPKAKGSDGSDSPHAIDPAHVDITASSTLDDDMTDHGPDNLLDGDDKTAWESGSPDGGPGEWIQISFKDGQSHRLDHLDVIVGDLSPRSKDSDPWEQHNRLSKVRITVGDRNVDATLNPNSKSVQKIDLSEMEGSALKIEVLGTVVGTSSDNHLAVSSFKLYAVEKSAE